MPDDLYADKVKCGRIVDEVVEKVADFESNHDNFFTEYNEIANHYRMITKVNPRKRTKGLAHTTVAEITRATETLCTVFYKILTAYDPNFWAIPGRRNISESDLAAISAVRVFQDRAIAWKRKLLRGLRSLSLFGGLFYDEPWVASAPTDPGWEATDFRPKSYLNIAFDRRASDVNEGEFISTFDYVNKYRLMWLIANDPHRVWNKEGIEGALSMAPGTDATTQRVKNRMSSAGYIGNDTKGVFEYILYRGYLNEMKDYKEYVVGILNRKHLIKCHLNKLPHGERGVQYAGLIEFELEPLGYGVGNLGLRPLKDMNVNRARMSDIITFSLFSIWKSSRYAGVDMNTMQVKPWNIIEMDDITQFEPIKPDMMGVREGMRLEDRMKEDFRAMTAATSGLQAIVTEATAREAIMAQNEAIRRVSVYGEVLAENLIRRRHIRAHKNNMKFLDRDIWVAVGGDKPVLRVRPDQIAKDVSFLPKIITDKDFTPQRNRRLIEFLELLTSGRVQLPPEVQPVIMGIISELGRGLEIDMEAAQRKAGPPGDRKMQRLQELAMMLGGAGGGGQGGLPGVRGPQERLAGEGVVSPAGARGVAS